MNDIKSDTGIVNAAGQPALEVVSKRGRRKFAWEYKRHILAELDQAERGQATQILRREGLYSGTVGSWRKERDRALEAKARGPKPNPDTALRRENQELLKRADSTLKCNSE